MGIELLTVLVSAGGAAMVAALVQAWRALRSGAIADEKDQIELADDRRRVAEAERDHAITVANYWRTRAGTLEFTLTKHCGPESIPTFPPEPARLEETTVHVEARSSDTIKGAESSQNKKG